MKKQLFLMLFACAFREMLSQNFSQDFTITGNYTVPPGVTAVTVEVIGAGGNGGSNGGGGGAGGGYARGVYSVVPGASIPVVVGLAGGGAAGGVTSFSTFAFAAGGTSGSSNSSAGGTGGAGTGGNVLNRSGGNGGNGSWTYFGGGGGGAAGLLSNGSNGGNSIVFSGICQYPGASAGAGGGAPAGAGGKGAGFKDVSCSVTDSAGPGLNYGGGGGGGNGIGSTPGQGAGGLCRISWAGCVVPTPPVNLTPPANLKICGSGTSTLIASGTGTLSWFTSPTSMGVINTGSICLININSTSTFYIEDSTCAKSPGRTAITVTVYPTPTITAVSNHITSCKGQPVNIILLGAGTYSWNAVLTPAMLVISPTVTTVYTITGEGVGSCTASAMFTQSVSACTGIEAYDKEEKAISIYPNPGDGAFVISSNRGCELTLIDEWGQTVTTLLLNNTNEYKISVHSLAPGIYFIIDKKSGYRCRDKIIVSR